MTENTRFQSKRSRTVLGLVVVALSCVVPVAFVGVSLASGSPTSATAAQYQYGKVTICHHTGSKKKAGVTITISQNAWKAHQKHGDTLGPCPAAPPKAKDDGKDKGKGKGKDDSDAGADKGKPGETPAKPADPPGLDKRNGNGNGNGKGNGKGK